jgi:RNA polymerase sigma factor (TIGR02999 family)
MEAGDSGDITALIAAWRGGDAGALNELVPLAFPKLHSLAEAFLRREKDCQTLQATALVNELYLLLRKQRKVGLADRHEFYCFAAFLIRLILYNRARDRRSQKRGAGAVRVPLSEDLRWIDAAGDDMLDLNQALDELVQLSTRQARLLDLTVFLGCTIQEAATLLNMSTATANRQLRFVKAWLYQRLRGQGRDPEPRNSTSGP